jgi:collagenase-like PrtC family protease
MELLIPAGNNKHVELALKTSPNAVYGGFRKFNARNKAINFSVEDYNESVEILHEKNIKFYLTLNILVTDDEIKEILDLFKKGIATLPDAFIVADIGLAIALKREFFRIPLHFSTQFGAHNEEDLKILAYLGASRVILARELTLSEINKLKEKTSLELECFIWGTQCLSFSGLCFFNSLLNCGNANRGKCIIACRDIYNVNAVSGQLLYVPDLDLINAIPQLKGINCIKLEGRRRDVQELEEVIGTIKSGKQSEKNRGFLYGENVTENGLYEIVNNRIKPMFRYKDLKNINTNDIFVQYKNGIPISFTKKIKQSNVYYVYSEIKNDFDVNKKNISFELKIDKDFVSEILYLNHRGNGKTFYTKKEGNRIDFSVEKFFNKVIKLSDEINIYKIRYKRNIDDKYTISKKMLDEIINYVKKNCKNINYRKISTKINPIKKLYVETNNLEVLDSLLYNEFVKPIYNIDSFIKLKNIEKIISKYDDQIIYKLPLFNWKSENSYKYLKLLKNKDVMFTRFSQIYLSKNIKFKNKFVDYTVYIWNREALNFLKSYNISHFTASPELSYEKNISIFRNKNIQFIVGGKLPLIYSRQCFSHLFKCRNCLSSNKKIIKNSDKNMEFEILCPEDNRCLIYKEPILNNYQKVAAYNKSSFRYMTYGQTIDEIKKSIELFKSNNYFDLMKKNNIWKNSYENNILEDRI